jgi:phosphate transport system substrate-binding protein
MCPSNNKSQVFVFIIFFASALIVFPPAQALAETLRLGGSGSTTAVAKVLAEAYGKKYPQDSVSVSPALGTPGGIKALNAKVVDVALASRALNDAERASGLTAVEFARTPLVMAVAAANPLNDIGFAHLSRLYSATDAIWPNGTRVRLVLRPKDDSDTKIVTRFSPDMAKAMETALARPGAMVAATDEDAIGAIQRLPGAIGPTTLAQILIDKRPLKALALEGRPPTVEAARAGKYPYFKHHFLVIHAAASPAAKRFIEFAQSAEAAQLLTANGC